MCTPGFVRQIMPNTYKLPVYITLAQTLEMSYVWPPSSLSLLYFLRSASPWPKSRDSSVDIAADYGLEDRMIGVRFPTGDGNSLLHHVHSGSGPHPATIPTGTDSSFPGGKAVGTWRWPLTSIYCWGRRMRGAIFPFPQYVLMAWCLVKLWDNFSFSFALANVEDIYIFMILCDFFACCPHNFISKLYMYGILNTTCKSRVGVRLGKLPVVRRTLFCRRLSFKRWLSAANSQEGQT